MSREELVLKIRDEKIKYHQLLPNKLNEMVSIEVKSPYYMVEGWDFQ